MGLLNLLAWTSVAKALPGAAKALLEAVAARCAEHGSLNDAAAIEELQVRVADIERDQLLTNRYLRYVIIALLVLIIISITALVLGIIALSQY